MPATAPIKLYMGKNVSDLNKTSEYKYEPGRSIKIHINHSDKVFSAATEAKQKRDEERAYVLFMRYIDIVQKVRKSRDFKKDPQHFGLLMGTKRLMQALDFAEELNKSLSNRYEELEAKAAAEKLEKTRLSNGESEIPKEVEKPSTEKSNLPSEEFCYLTCKQLYDVMFSKTRTNPAKVMVLDIRSKEDYKESSIKHELCINVPQSHIKPGTVCSKIEEGIYNDDHLHEWYQRATCDLIVMLDWRCATSRLQNQADPLRSLKDALYKWEQSVFLKRAPIILQGGYVEWLEFYPQFTTNSKVNPPPLDKKPDTSVNSLLNFNFGKAVEEPTATETEEESPNVDRTEENGVEETPDSNILSTSEKPASLASSNGILSPVTSQTLPSSGLYPSIPEDISLKTTKKYDNPQNDEPIYTDVKKPTKSQPTTSKTTPVINRSLKPKMPSRDSKPKIDEPPKQDGLSDWPPSSFLSDKSLDRKEPVKHNSMQDVTDGNDDESAYLSEVAKMQRQKEENERITREIMMKKKKTEQEAALAKMKREIEESEIKRRKAEKEYADSLRANTKPKTEVKSLDKTKVNSKDTSTKPQSTIIPPRSTKPGVSRETKPIDQTTDILKPEIGPQPIEQRKNLQDEDNSPSKAVKSSSGASQDDTSEKSQISDSLKKDDASLKVTTIDGATKSTTVAPTASKPTVASTINKPTASVTTPQYTNNPAEKPQNNTTSTAKSQSTVVSTNKSSNATNLTSKPHNNVTPAIKPSNTVTPVTKRQSSVTPTTNKSSNIEPTNPKSPVMNSSGSATNPSTKAYATKSLISTNDFAVNASKEKETISTPHETAGLPINWEKRLDTKTGRYFYLDHKTQTTHWMLPDDVRRSVKRVPLKDETSAPTSGSLKRSHSTPNIAQAIEEENSAITPHIPNRGSKPSLSQASYESPDILNARLRSLNPVFGATGKGLCGLRNLGNTCYMNSVLQCMFNTAQMVQYFLNDIYKHDINRENFMGSGGEITDGFAIVLKAVWSGEFRQITPRDFRSIIAKINPRFGGYVQQDSQELLLFLMDGLHEDLNRVTHRQYIEDKDNHHLNDQEAAKLAWVNHKKLNESIIVELFQGQFRATTQCQHCLKKSRKFDVFMYLTLPLPTSSSCSLMDAIAKFSEPEELTGGNKWKCPWCKCQRNASRIIEIWKLPPVLLIHLKRFSFSHRYADKIQTNVKFPTKQLDLSRAVRGQAPNKLYNLYAVSHHHGNTMDSGHYIATCKSGIDGNWYKYDDEAVSKTSAPSGPTAYILCYTSLKHQLQLQVK